MAQIDALKKVESGITKNGADFSRNNLDCLRLILAAIVVLFHVSALTGLPAFSVFEKYCSPHFAVRSFFVISGLLIYRSYTRSSSIGSYFEKRARRIYPAYFVVIILVATALCSLSALPLSRYFGNGFCKYLGANLLFLNFLAPSLPGVFTLNSLSAVNGALWTLKIEVVFYLFVPLMHFMCSRFGTRKTVGGIFLFSCCWKYGFAFLAATHNAPNGSGGDAPRSIYSQLDVQFPAQLVYFTAGILLLLYFDWLALHFRSILGITVCLFVIDQFFTGDALDVLWISGMVFVFGFWRYFGEFSKYGDFSYGAYIVHWPLLQILIALGFASLNPALFLLLALSLIAAASVLMWHLVESRFLSRGSHYRQASLSTPA
jgi:peptidoglycan/LPS O-acetylase OafA/YrhL